MADTVKFSERLAASTRNGDSVVILGTRVPAPSGYQNRDDYLVNLRELYDTGAQVTNVKSYNASGSSATTTLAAGAGASSTTLNLASAASFAVGHGIYLAGAGVAGAKYVGAVISKNGNIVGISPATSTTVASGAVVKHDDTASIQAAIDAGAPSSYESFEVGSVSFASNVIFLPRGMYRCSSGLVLSKCTSLFGAGSRVFDADGEVTSLNFADMAAGVGITLAGNSAFNWVRGLELRGPAAANQNTTGIASNSAIGFHVEDVLIKGWGIGCNYYALSGRHIGVHIDNCYGDCLLLRECNYWSSFDSTNGNSVVGSSIHLSADGEGCKFVSIYDPQTDESGGAATIQIDKGFHISLNNMVVYTSVGGYGVRLGDGTNSPTHVYLNNVRIKQYQDYTPSKVIKNLWLRGSGHKVTHVITEKGTHTPPADDVQDDTSDSILLNLNGRHSLRLPTSAAGLPAGSLWSSGGLVSDAGAPLARDTEPLSVAKALGSVIKTQRFAVDRVSTSFSLTSGVARFEAIYLAVAATITGVKWWQSNQGDYTANNNNYVALYSYAGGTLTRVAISANDGNIWKATAQALASAAFVTPYAAAAGLYFIASLYNTSAQTTAPSLGATAVMHNAGLAALDFTNSGLLAATLASQTALPTPQAMSALTGVANQPWWALY